MRDRLQIKKRLTFGRIIIAFTLLFVGGLQGYSHLASPVSAGPEIVGNPVGADTRALYQSGDGEVRKITYFAQGVKTMANTTPVTSAPFCGLGDQDIFEAQVVLSGTMTGTNPTLTVLWQQSFDGGVTWVDVGTWTAINSTVTPAVQRQTVAEVANNSTAVALGDCWRARYTFGGSGTVTANIGITGYAEGD